MSAFWMSYVEIVEIMLQLLRASRERNWELHLSSISEMIPWCFAYDRQNYSRYLSVYLSDMTNLPIDHPQQHTYLSDGRFAANVGNSKVPFTSIPIDQTLNETVNKDTQHQEEQTILV